MIAWRTIQCLALAVPLVAAGGVCAQGGPVAPSQFQTPVPSQLQAQASPPSPAPAAPPSVAPDVAMHIAIERLRTEGRQFRHSGSLPRQQPDFADTFSYLVRPDDVIDAIVCVQDRDDAAVDGYIRWQLLSFDVDLAGMDNADYDRLIGHLPGLTRRASADTQLHSTLEGLARGAGRNADVKAEMERRWDALHFADKQIELLNQPSLKFRDAAAQAMPETGARRLGVLLFDLQGRIAAASDTRSVKAAVTRTLRERMMDDSMSPQQRWELLKFVEGLPGPRSKVVRDVAFYANQPADVLYSTYAIRSSDVKKWTAYLNRHEP